MGKKESLADVKLQARSFTIKLGMALDEQRVASIL